MMGRAILITVLLMISPVAGPRAADWCERAEGGQPGSRAFPLDLSIAHAAIRFFSAHASYSTVDQALTHALSRPGALSLHANLALEDYAARLESACAVPVSSRRLEEARVELIGDVAVVRPGTGAVVLPAGTRAVAIDLRELPASERLRSILLTAVAPTLATPAAWPSAVLRRHDGMTDEVFAAANVYGNSLELRDGLTIAAAGSEALPLAFLTGGRMPPTAVELAATLRLQNRAWLIGDDLFAAIAESRWVGLGSPTDTEHGPRLGLLFRDRDLYLQTETLSRWPDLIPADLPSEDPSSELDGLSTMGFPPTLPQGSGLRARHRQMDPFQDFQPATTDPGSALAALVVVHGAARMFFPYFDIVGQGFDDRLLELLAELEAHVPTGRSRYDGAILGAISRGAVRTSLRRLGEALSDGHSFVLDYAPRRPRGVGYFPAYFDESDGLPVVTTSAIPGLPPGSSVVAIDGRASPLWLTREYRTISASTDGHRFAQATRRLIGPGRTREFAYRTPSGARGTVIVPPAPYSAVGDLTVEERGNGWLDDLGAGDLYYINLSRNVVSVISSVETALAEANGSRGLVVDMRGYPGVNHYTVADWLICESFSSPRFNVRQVVSRDEPWMKTGSYDFDGPNKYCGPIALLVGPGTVSAAENFATMLVDAGRVTVVGRQSAGTNGNITGVMLPGRFAFTFTGMQVLHANGDRFHGIGILPDVEVSPRPIDFLEGRDRVLEAAIDTF